MSVGTRHTLGGYSFIETLHGPNGPDACVDCGAATVSVVPTGRIGAGGMAEDTGGGVASRCDACGRKHRNAPYDHRSTVRGVPLGDGGLAARRAWQDAQDAAGLPLALPVATHTSRDPFPAGLSVPGGPAAVRAYAERCGWSVQVTYSVGPWLGSRSTALVRCLGVRARLGDRFALAFWTAPLVTSKWMFRNALVAGGPAGVYSRCGVADVREYLGRQGEVEPMWFASITARIDAATLAAKVKAKSRPRKVKGVAA